MGDMSFAQTVGNAPARSFHRELQLLNLVDICESIARVSFRCAKKADQISDRPAAAHFRARGTKALRIATIAALKTGM